ncbi:MAG: DUF4282 domain-containing protein [Gammaproteobacteria bacterium]
MDFLTFRDFISTEVLIIFYYLGAVVMPVGIWLLLTWLVHKYRFLNIAHQTNMHALWNTLTRKQKLKLIVFFVILFLFMELFWRMFFEFLIAYMQMRDALLAH